MALCWTNCERWPALAEHVTLRRVRLGEHPLLAAPVAGDPQEPRRERPERLVQGFPAGR